MFNYADSGKGKAVFFEMFCCYYALFDEVELPEYDV